MILFTVYTAIRIFSLAIERTSVRLILLCRIFITSDFFKQPLMRFEQRSPIVLKLFRKTVGPARFSSWSVSYRFSTICTYGLLWVVFFLVEFSDYNSHILSRSLLNACSNFVNNGRLGLYETLLSFKLVRILLSFIPSRREFSKSGLVSNRTGIVFFFTKPRESFDV